MPNRRHGVSFGWVSFAWGLLALLIAVAPVSPAAGILPPVADAGADLSVIAGALVELDGTKSSDPQGLALSYRWTFDDGSPDETDSLVQRRYFLPGVFKARLAVTNGAATAEDELAVTVTPGPIRPPAEAGGGVPSLAPVDVPATGTVLAFYPQAPRLVRSLSILIDGGLVAMTNLYRWDVDAKDSDGVFRWSVGPHKVAFVCDYGAGAPGTPWKGEYRWERTYVVKADRDGPVLEASISDADPARAGVQPMPRVNGSVWIELKSTGERALFESPAIRIRNAAGAIVAESDRHFLRWNVAAVPDGVYVLETTARDQRGNETRKTWDIPLRHDPGAVGAAPALSRTSPPDDSMLPYGAFFPLAADPNRGSAIEWRLGDASFEDVLPYEVKENEYHGMIRGLADPPIFEQFDLGLSPTTRTLGGAYGGSRAILSSANPPGGLLEESFRTVFESVELGASPTGGILGAAVGQLPDGVWPGEDIALDKTIRLRGFASDVYQGVKTDLLSYRLSRNGAELFEFIPGNGVADIPAGPFGPGAYALEQAVEYSYSPPGPGGAVRSLRYGKTVPFNVWRGTIEAASLADDPDTAQIEFAEETPCAFAAGFEGTSMNVVRGRWYVDTDPGPGEKMALIQPNVEPVLFYVFPKEGQYRVEFKSVIRTAWDPVNKTVIRKGIETLLPGGQEFLEREVSASMDVSVFERRIRDVVVSQTGDSPPRNFAAYTLSAGFPEGLRLDLLTFREGPAPTIPMTRRTLEGLPNARGRHIVYWDGLDVDGEAIDLEGQVGTAKKQAAARNITVAERQTERGELELPLGGGMKKLTSIRSADGALSPVAASWSIPEADQARGAFLKAPGLDPNAPGSLVYETTTLQNVTFVPRAVGDCRVRLFLKGSGGYGGVGALEDERYTLTVRVKESPTYSMRILDKDGDEVGMGAPVSVPHPVITLEPPPLKQIELEGNLAIFTLKGTVTDALADIVPEGKANIRSVFIGEQEIPVTPVPEAATDWRPFAFKGKFETKGFLPLAKGANRLQVKAVNAIGNEGYAYVEIMADFAVKDRKTDRPVYPFPGPLEVVLGEPGAGGTVPPAALRILSEPDEAPADPVEDWRPTHPKRPFEYQGTVEGAGKLGVRLYQAVPVPAPVPGQKAVKPPPGSELGYLPPGAGSNGPPALDPGKADFLWGVATPDGSDASVPVLLKETGPATRRFVSIQDRVEARLVMNPTTKIEDKIVLDVRPWNGPARSVTLALNPKKPGVFAGKDGGAVTFEMLVRRDAVEGASPAAFGGTMTWTRYGKEPAEMVFVQNGEGTAAPYRLIGEGLVPGGLSHGPLFVQTFKMSQVSVGGTDAGTFLPMRIEVLDSDPAPTARFAGREIPLKVVVPGVSMSLPFVGVARAPAAMLPNVFAASDEIYDPKAEYKKLIDVKDLVLVGESDVSHAKRAPGTKTILTIESTIWDFFEEPGVTLSSNMKEVSVRVIPGSVWVPGPGIQRRSQVEVTVSPDAPVGAKCTLSFRGLGNHVDLQQAIEVVPLRVVIFGIDGLDHESFKEALSKKAPGLTKVFGATLEKAVDFSPVLDVMPSVTWLNWVTITTGMAPNEHGIPGIAYFMRDRKETVPISCSNYTNALRILPLKHDGDTFSDYEVVVRGRLNNHLRTEPFRAGGAVPKSMYTQVAEKFPGTTSASVYNFISEGATKPVHYDGAASVVRAFFIQGPAMGIYRARKLYLQSTHSRTSGDHLDKIGFEKSLEYWNNSAKGAPHLMFIYLPGPDNYGHTVGTDETFDPDRDFPEEARRKQIGTLQKTIVKKYLESTDHRILDFANETEKLGWMASTVFVLISDHGLTGFFTKSSSPIDVDRRSITLAEVSAGSEPKITQKEMQAVLERATTPSGGTTIVWNGVGLKDCWAVFGPNGGMAHIYLRGKEGWQTPPSDDYVKEMAKALYDAATKKPGVAVPDGPGEVYESLGTPPAILVRLRESTDGTAGRYRWFVKRDEKYLDVGIEELAALPRSKNWVDFAFRMNEEVNDFVPGNPTPRSGDIIILSDVENGYLLSHHSGIYPGWHGGPTKWEGEVPMVFGTSGDLALIQEAKDAFTKKNPGAKGRTRHMVPLILDVLQTQKDRWKAAQK